MHHENKKQIVAEGNRFRRNANDYRMSVNENLWMPRDASGVSIGTYRVVYKVE
jgi:hypothetical protein